MTGTYTSIYHFYHEYWFYECLLVFIGRVILNVTFEYVSSKWGFFFFFFPPPPLVLWELYRIYFGTSSTVFFLCGVIVFGFYFLGTYPLLWKVTISLVMYAHLSSV